MSTVQLFGDGINTGDVKNAFGNWAKLGLGVLSVVFDVSCFMRKTSQLSMFLRYFASA